MRVDIPFFVLKSSREQILGIRYYYYISNLQFSCFSPSCLHDPVESGMGIELLHFFLQEGLIFQCKGMTVRVVSPSSSPNGLLFFFRIRRRYELVLDLGSPRGTHYRDTRLHLIT